MNIHKEMSGNFFRNSQKLGDNATVQGDFDGSFGSGFGCGFGNWKNVNVTTQGVVEHATAATAATTSTNEYKRFVTNKAK